MITVAQAEARLVRFQLDRPVGGSGVSFVDVIIVDVVDSDGATGMGFSYVLAADGAVSRQAAQLQLERFVIGQPVLPPQALWKSIVQSFNRTGLGPNLIGLAAIDVAIWDLHSKRRGVPLAVAVGGDPRLTDVYGSGGFTAGQEPRQAADAASRYLARGFKAVKPRVLGDRSDVKLLRAIRDAVGDNHFMLDANEKCDLAAARWLMSLAQEHGALFIEEPIPTSALAGYRALAPSSVAIAAGEHLQQLETFVTLMTERVLSVVQPDLAMIGGITPILDLCVVAGSLGIVVSPHFLPGLFVHLAAAAPNLRWLEDFPLLEPMFEGWPSVTTRGQMEPGSAAGHGLVLCDRYRNSGT